MSTDDTGYQQPLYKRERDIIQFNQTIGVFEETLSALLLSFYLRFTSNEQ